MTDFNFDFDAFFGRDAPKFFGLYGSLHSQWEADHLGERMDKAMFWKLAGPDLAGVDLGVQTRLVDDLNFQAVGASQDELEAFVLWCAHVGVKVTLDRQEWVVVGRHDVLLEEEHEARWVEADWRESLTTVTLDFG